MKSTSIFVPKISLSTDDWHALLLWLSNDRVRLADPFLKPGEVLHHNPGDGGPSTLFVDWNIHRSKAGTFPKMAEAEDRFFSNLLKCTPDDLKGCDVFYFVLDA